MILIGVSWVIFWGLLKLDVELSIAAVFTGVIMIILGLACGERPFFNRQ
jgi:hypothetical protein